MITRGLSGFGHLGGGGGGVGSNDPSPPPGTGLSTGM